MCGTLDQYNAVMKNFKGSVYRLDTTSSGQLEALARFPYKSSDPYAHMPLTLDDYDDDKCRTSKKRIFGCTYKDALLLVVTLLIFFYLSWSTTNTNDWIALLGLITLQK